MSMAQRLLVLLGFAAGHRVSAMAYLTAFGALDSGVGFVASPEFTTAANVAAVAVSALIAILSRLVKKPFFLPYSLLAVLAVVAFEVAAVLEGPPSSATLAALGVVYAFTFFVMNMCWFEVMAFDTPVAATIVFLIAYLFSSCMAPVLGMLDVPLLSLTVPGLALSAVIMMGTRRLCIAKGLENGFARGSLESGGAAGAMSSLAVLAVPVGAACVLECTTGLVNMSLIGGSFEYVVSTFPTWIGSMGSSVLLLAIIVVTRKSPRPLAVFNRLFPVLLASLLLLLLLGEDFGALAGLVLVFSYNLVTSSLVYFYFTVAHKRGTSVLFLQGASNVCIKLFLVAGFAIGQCLLLWSNKTSVASGFIIMVCAVYLLAMGAFFLRGNLQQKAEGALGASCSAGDITPGTASSDEVHDGGDRRGRTIRAIAQRYSLTKRECEIYSYLVRGWGAKQIASSLFVSENTVWGHVRHIYAKLGVNSKQDAINRFEEQMGKGE